jgi:putative DNA primase/helicase
VPHICTTTTPDTTQQKIFLLVGPRRSGKGTIARVLTAMLGRENVAGPTLYSLTQNFGLASLIGKPLAIISDARLSGRSDASIVVERLLAISGEDTLSVPRKYREDWTGQLPTRLLVLTNELPRLSDASGALASRFVILVMTRSFYGKEDHGLTGKLVTELPSILNWAIDGRDRLTKRGHFIQPTSAQQAAGELADLASPIGAFVRDRCSVGPEYAVDTGAIYKAWVIWCRQQNREHPGTKQAFGRDLRAAVPGLTITQPRDAKTHKQLRSYQGIGLAL